MLVDKGFGRLIHRQVHERLPLVLHEDDDLLVVTKPPGWNTHAPDPFAGEGLYDWLRHREPRWADLAILHRLDKATSGVIVFGKTPRANRSLAGQFARHRVRKLYRLWASAPGPAGEVVVDRPITTAGSRRQVTSAGHGLPAKTRFRPAGHCGGRVELIAEPVTGRTHQIRVHAAASGFPVVGDALYGGAPFPRLCLHAESLGFLHPADGRPVMFRAPAEFRVPPGEALRNAFLDPALTNTCRLVHGEADGEPNWFVERLGDWLLSQSPDALSPEREERLRAWHRDLGLHGVFHQRLDRHVRGRRPEETTPVLFAGEPPEGPAIARENGLRWELAFDRGYSFGLFLDQRDNRRRLLTRHVAAQWPSPTPAGRQPELLNCFAYTCAFSVAAAVAGARTTSVDLSRPCLEWGQRNFRLNGLDPEAHEFLLGDAFDWLRRLARKGRRFDVVVLDPPTFSSTKRGRRFSAVRDYGRLVTAAGPLVAPGGCLLASTNAGAIRPAAFLGEVEEALARAGRRILARHYVPQPPDFPVTRQQPAHLKTVWLHVA